MSDKPFRFGPVAMGIAGADVVKGPVQAAAGTGVPAQDIYLLIRHIHIVNKTSSSATFSLWLGASGAGAAGTEVIGQGLTVRARWVYDWYGMMRMEAADYLVGISDTTTALVIQGEGIMVCI